MTVLQLPLPSLPRTERDWVTTSELINASGLSVRQVDYMIRTNLIHALNPDAGYGHPRRYGLDQVTRAQVIRHLLDAGLNLAVIREHLDQILADHRIQIGPVTITVHPTGEAS